MVHHVESHLPQTNPSIRVSKNMGKEFFSCLKCRECGREFPKKAVHVCEYDFGPLEAVYNYDEIRHSISRSVIASRPETMWRYKELLPLDGEPTVGLATGFTPLIKADRLAKALGSGNSISRTIR